jgi:hypothetical protein
VIGISKSRSPCFRASMISSGALKRYSVSRSSESAEPRIAR